MIIFKTFSTPKGDYFYDRNTNKIVKISKEDLECLKKSKERNGDIGKNKTIEKYQKKGYLMESKVEEIEHPELCDVEHCVDNRLENVVLQVTQSCNLRCTYCIYSGNYYNNRTHNNNRMNWDIAKSTIDYFVEHSVEMKRIRLGFYGGEPLLEFDLIKKCVNYIKAIEKDKEIGFAIATNGTLLTQEIADFLLEHDFYIQISLDGSKNDHNRYRVFADGTGSYDTIFNNLISIRKNTPEFIKKVTFNAIINPNNGYLDTKKYFEQDTITAEANVMLHSVNQQDSKVDIQFSDEFHQAREYDYFVFLLAMLGKVDEQSCVKWLLVEKSGIIARYRDMRDTLEIGKKCHHSGPCMPGARRLLVTVKGDFYPCEKTSEISPATNIGSVDNGINYEKCREILNIGKITEDECKNCWALLHCVQCIDTSIDENGISAEKKLKNCPLSRQMALKNFKEICMLKELGFAFEEEE